MSDNETRELVKRELGLISLPLYEFVSAGFAQASARLNGLENISDYPWLVSQMARAAMRNEISRAVPDGWQLTGRPQMMGQTILTNPKHNFSLRLLKENRRTHPGGVPPAGATHVRQSLWQSHELALFSIRDLVPMALDSTSALHLLWLWDWYEAESGDIGVTVRVVHTLAASQFGQAVPLDLNYEISARGSIFDKLHFQGDPEEDDLFANIDAKENREDGTA